MKLLDTWAWIEYFEGSAHGIKIKEIISKNEVYTSAISLAEISRWFYQNNFDVDLAVRQIKQNSVVITLSEPILIEAGKKFVDLRKTRKNIGMIDVLIYVTALFYDFDLITNDPDLKGLPSVETL